MSDPYRPLYVEVSIPPREREVPVVQKRHHFGPSGAVQKAVHMVVHRLCPSHYRCSAYFSQYTDGVTVRVLRANGFHKEHTFPLMTLDAGELINEVAAFVTAPVDDL